MPERAEMGKRSGPRFRLSARKRAFPVASRNARAMLASSMAANEAKPQEPFRYTLADTPAVDSLVLTVQSPLMSDISADLFS